MISSAVVGNEDRSANWDSLLVLTEPDEDKSGLKEALQAFFANQGLSSLGVEPVRAFMKRVRISQAVLRARSRPAPARAATS